MKEALNNMTKEHHAVALADFKKHFNASEIHEEPGRHPVVQVGSVCLVPLLDSDLGVVFYRTYIRGPHSYFIDEYTIEKAVWVFRRSVKEA